MLKKSKSDSSLLKHKKSSKKKSKTQSKTQSSVKSNNNKLKRRSSTKSSGSKSLSKNPKNKIKKTNQSGGVLLEQIDILDGDEELRWGNLSKKYGVKGFPEECVIL